MSGYLPFYAQEEEVYLKLEDGGTVSLDWWRLGLGRDLGVHDFGT